MSALSFTVYGTPAPQGSKRHVGKGVMVESSKAVKPWREAVKWAAIEAVAGPYRPMFTEPVAVSLSFYLAKPKSTPKRVLWPAKRPDIDKLIRSTLDALGDAAVWGDDAQVVKIEASKEYASEHVSPGVDVTVRAA